MTLRIELTPLAETDLDSIWDFTTAKWGAGQAAQYLSDISQAVARAAAYPMMGSDQSNIRKGVRKVRSGSHSIYYRHDDHALRVLRILHVRMDVESTLPGL